MIVNGAFLAERIRVLPKRELCSHLVGAYGVFSTNMCPKVAARREVLPGRQDLLKSATTTVDCDDPGEVVLVATTKAWKIAARNEGIQLQPETLSDFVYFNKTASFPIELRAFFESDPDFTTALAIRTKSRLRASS